MSYPVIMETIIRRTSPLGSASNSIAIHWFRQDLRLSDNPALSSALKSGRLRPIYILDEENAEDAHMGDASRWWLHHSLTELNRSLNGNLRFYRGDATRILPKIAAETGAGTVSWNRCYEPWRIKRDKEIKEMLKEDGITVITENGSLLWEPWEILKSDGSPYRVFTPFYRQGRNNGRLPREPIAASGSISFAPAGKDPETVDLADLNLLPKSNWTLKREPDWRPGEAGAQAQVRHFLENGLNGYKTRRNFPAAENCSRLSPYLHFGELSPHQVWHALSFKEHMPELDDDIGNFKTELAWREFSYSLLFFNPGLSNVNLQEKFDNFPWRSDAAALKAWQKGRTGIPFVDAGMRELWQTGYMHNRVRMIVSSFLSKNLMIDWREGARRFWDCLVDADLANNSASWQWVSGTGADAAPYFRIFNPVTQGTRFDPNGDYTRKYVPEIAALPNKWLFNPWEAPADILKDAGIVLGQTYPAPIVDLKTSRRRALDAFSDLNDSKKAGVAS